MNSNNENTQHNSSSLPEDKITLDNDISDLPASTPIVDSAQESTLKSQWYSTLTTPLSNPITPPIFTALL